jgi:hypothetical protein
MPDLLAVQAPPPAPSLGFYSWHVGTLRDGRITNDLPMVDTSWSVVMDDAAPLSGSLILTDPDVAALNPYLTAEPCRCFLAVSYTDPDGTETFLAGGPIWTHAYDDTTKTLTIGAAGLWSYYDHRKVLPVLSAGVNPATVTTSMTSSLGTIAKQLVQLAHTHTAGALPVVFPADESGSNVRTYAGSAMTQVGQALRDLTGVQGGPEIQFVPRRTAADPRYIEWVMRIGTTAKPLLSQAGDDWTWDATVPKSSVTGISVNRDGTQMADRAWEQGAGSDISTLFSQANDTTLTTAGFPLLEVLDSTHTDVTVQATLDTWVAGLLASSVRPVETWTVKVRRDEPPNVAQYAVGDYVSLTIGGLTRLGVQTATVDGNDVTLVTDGGDTVGLLDGNPTASSEPVTTVHPYLPSGTYRSRILSISGDDSYDVTLQLAPTAGGI